MKLLLEYYIMAIFKLFKLFHIHFVMLLHPNEQRISIFRSTKFEDESLGSSIFFYRVLKEI
jgi:hypothetical protein